MPEESFASPVGLHSLGSASKALAWHDAVVLLPGPALLLGVAIIVGVGLLISNWISKR